MCILFIIPEPSILHYIIEWKIFFHIDKGQIFLIDDDWLIKVRLEYKSLDDKKNVKSAIDLLNKALFLNPIRLPFLFPINKEYPLNRYDLANCFFLTNGSSRGAALKNAR